jgi:hypothetical protein
MNDDQLAEREKILDQQRCDLLREAGMDEHQARVRFLDEQRKQLLGKET